MKNVGVCIVTNRTRLFGAVALLALIVATGSQSKGSSQASEDWAIGQAQRAVREQIVNREGGRNQNVRFSGDAQTESRPNSRVLVRGTGSFSQNNNQNDNPRNSDGRSRDFSYQATVDNRNRYGNTNGMVSGIRYDWRGGWSGNGSDDYRGGNGAFRVQTISCASDDGRRHTCPINNIGGAVRLLNQRRGSNCVQGQTWGFNNTAIWVDRGCRADFEVSGGRGSASNGRDNDRGDNNNGYRNVNRPDGRMSYSGPIMNRNSDKSLDVTEQGTEDGANIQQWGYAGQPNQNWDVIDLGNNQVAILNRHSGRALTVQGGRDNNGAGIIQRVWNDNPQQRWRLEQTGGDYYRIVSVDNGKCLDVSDQSKANGANIQLWDYANQANQQWRFKR